MNDMMGTYQTIPSPPPLICNPRGLQGGKGLTPTGRSCATHTIVSTSNRTGGLVFPIFLDKCIEDIASRLPSVMFMPITRPFDEVFICAFA